MDGTQEMKEALSCYVFYHLQSLSGLEGFLVSKAQSSHIAWDIEYNQTSDSERYRFEFAAIFNAETSNA